LSEAQVRAVCNVADFTREVEESKALDRAHTPMVIVSASGMATGGRVLHHLNRFAPDPRNTILFTGFQAGGTRGADIVGGAKSVRIHGKYVPIRAQVEKLDMLSAHADANEIMAWLKSFKRAPRLTFITHGEPDAAEALRRRIRDELDWNCRVPAYRDEAELE
jgi:metallo-beta-lactamase family protein